MTKLRAHNISMSLDGFIAGPDQSIDHPLGIGGQQLHDWAFASATWQRLHGGGEADSDPVTVDDGFIARGVDGIGATLMGRNMFGPVRGPWERDGAEPWDGWWGAEPPFHHPVVVLTHHARDPLPMAGGTTFHFQTGGLDAGVEQAIAAAGGQDVRVGGGASTLRELLRRRLLDELHVAVAPVVLGAGERLFDGAAAAPPHYEVVEVVPSGRILHVRLVRA